MCHVGPRLASAPKNAEKHRQNDKSEQPGMRNFHLPGRSTVHSLNAMVTTSHPLAALTAIEVMRAGGTAADAAVAACALLGVIEPQSTGIGGDCFALIQPRGEGKIVAYNGSGCAPMAATPEWYLEHNIKAIPLTSPHAVTIPGAVDAWTVILRDHGKFGLDTLLQPAIKAAEEGYVVAPRIAFDWNNGQEKLRGGTHTARYLLPHGKPPVAGDVIRQPELGQTLRIIASEGREGFYAGRVAYLMREQDIGDPAYVDIDIQRILSKEFAADYASKIHMDALIELPKVSPPINPSTVYITVVDKDRNVCSFINSIAHSFGSAVVSNNTGVLLQNRGGGFRIQPGHPNCIAPGKRPLHTIIPSLVTQDGRAVMPFGVMGGQYQPVGQVHVLTNMLDYGCDIQEAIDMPRGLHYEGIYQLEDSVPAEIVEGLKKIGHKTASVVGPLGGGQAIWIDWDKGTLVGGSDPRKDGCALGY